MCGLDTIILQGQLEVVNNKLNVLKSAVSAALVNGMQTGVEYGSFADCTGTIQEFATTDDLSDTAFFQALEDLKFGWNNSQE